MQPIQGQPAFGGVQSNQYFRGPVPSQNNMYPSGGQGYPTAFNQSAGPGAFPAFPGQPSGPSMGGYGMGGGMGQPQYGAPNQPPQQYGGGGRGGYGGPRGAGQGGWRGQGGPNQQYRQPRPALTEAERENIARERQWQKQNLCCYFVQGQCRYGDNCRFAHEDKGQQCNFGLSCKHKHYARTPQVTEAPAAPANPN
eukprot:PhF_6_TR24183/c0_g1_i1/m.33690